MSEEQHYEMLWDCPTCKTQGLLAKSQRHCPACGQTQNPAKRYFPEPGKEVEVQGHRFVGADWRCAYCKSPNSAAAAFCCNCGAPQEGSTQVAAVADPLAAVEESAAEPASAPAPEPKTGGKPWRIVPAVIAVTIVAVLAGLFMTKHDATAEVAKAQWQREIEVERFAAVADSAWCDAVPGNAYSVTRSREVRSHRQVPDGKECHEKRVDKADGTFVKQQECTDKYRSEPVYDDKCSFRVNRWQVARTVKAGGFAGETPAWPTTAALGLRQGNTAGNLSREGRLGDERAGQRRERYVLDLSDSGETWQCEVPQALWERVRPGAAVALQVRALGGAVCDSIRLK